MFSVAWALDATHSLQCKYSAGATKLEDRREPHSDLGSRT